MSQNFSFLRAKFLIPVSERLGYNHRISDGYILWKGRTIIEVGEYNQEIGKKLLDAYPEQINVVGGKIPATYLEDFVQLNGVALPGFIKGHGHDHESSIIGIAKDRPLTEWLDGAVNLYGAFLEESEEELEKLLGQSPYVTMYLKARLDDIQHGITSCMVHHCNFNKYHVKEIVEANKQAGTKMIIAVGSQDRHYDDRILDTPEEAVKRVDSYYSQFNDGKYTWIVPGPDQFFSNGPDLLIKLKNWARAHNTLFHIHSSEEPKTTAWFKELYGMTPIEYGKSIDVLDSSTIVAHQVNNTPEDLQILAETGTNVIHNPLANTILGSGMPPLIEMTELGIPIAISTDGSGSADNQNIINAARVASQFQKAFHQNASLLPSSELLTYITTKPAQLLKLNAGSLESGKDADLVVVDLTRPNLVPTRQDNVIENIFWAASGNEISWVIANGKILVENYVPVVIDQGDICQKMILLSEKFDEYRRQQKVRRQTGSVE